MRPKARTARVDETPRLAHLPEVGRVPGRLPAERGDLRDDRAASGLVPTVDDDRGALPGARERDRPPDAARRAGDDDHPAAEPGARTASPGRLRLPGRIGFAGRPPVPPGLHRPWLARAAGSSRAHQGFRKAIRPMNDSAVPLTSSESMPMAIPPGSSGRLAVDPLEVLAHVAALGEPLAELGRPRAHHHVRHRPRSLALEHGAGRRGGVPDVADDLGANRLREIAAIPRRLARPRRRWPPCRASAPFGSAVTFQVHSRIGVSARRTLPRMSLLMFELSPALLRWSTRWPSCSITVKSYFGLPQSCFDQPGGIPLVPTGIAAQSSTTTRSAARTATATSKPTSAVIRTPARAFMRSLSLHVPDGSRARAADRGRSTSESSAVQHTGGIGSAAGRTRWSTLRGRGGGDGQRDLRPRTASEASASASVRGVRWRPAEARALVERRHAGERRTRRWSEVGDSAAELPRGLAGRRTESSARGGPKGAPVEGGGAAPPGAESASTVAPGGPGPDERDRPDERERAGAAQPATRLRVEPGRPVPRSPPA